MLRQIDRQRSIQQHNARLHEGRTEAFFRGWLRAGDDGVFRRFTAGPRSCGNGKQRQRRVGDGAACADSFQKFSDACTLRVGEHCAGRFREGQ